MRWYQPNLPELEPKPSERLQSAHLAVEQVSIQIEGLQMVKHGLWGEYIRASNQARLCDEE